MVNQTVSVLQNRRAPKCYGALSRHRPGKNAFLRASIHLQPRLLEPRLLTPLDKALRVIPFTVLGTTAGAIFAVLLKDRGFGETTGRIAMLATITAFTWYSYSHLGAADRVKNRLLRALDGQGVFAEPLRKALKRNFHEIVLDFVILPLIAKIGAVTSTLLVANLIRDPLIYEGVSDHALNLIDWGVMVGSFLFLYFQMYSSSRDMRLISALETVLDDTSNVGEK